jgi:hypothetical protein
MRGDPLRSAPAALAIAPGLMRGDPLRSAPAALAIAPGLNALKRVQLE